MNYHRPSYPWEDKTPEDTQVFFQPDGHGIFELVNWRFGADPLGNLCVFHDTKPDSDVGLKRYHTVDDNRLRFLPRERR